MKALASRRRHPAAILLVLMLALIATGGLYSLLAPKPAQAAVAAADDVTAGKKLFLANCATCHGLNAEGSKTVPSLAGVGAAAVDFQVGTGRMPLAGPG
ncbi:MAG TPA: cytochrome c, partial [Dermatophilaceae bacterium]